MSMTWDDVLRWIADDIGIEIPWISKSMFHDDEV